MLKQRIITACILIPLAVSAVYYLPLNYFPLLIGLITLLAAWEWASLIGIPKLIYKILFLFSLILPMIGIVMWTDILELLAFWLDWPEIRNYSGILEWGVIPPVLFWFLSMILIRNKPEQLLKLEIKFSYKVLIGWFILFSAWMFFDRTRVFYGSDMAMYFLILIWMADISAFFIGKKYGDTKLSPLISPGKTAAGFYAAIVSSVLCAIVLSLVFDFSVMSGADFALLSVVTVLTSIYGDLFFSLVKRREGVKDTGALLPGHGGILDRLDSIIAAAPIFYAGIVLIYFIDFYNSAQS